MTAAKENRVASVRPQRVASAGANYKDTVGIAKTPNWLKSSRTASLGEKDHDDHEVDVRGSRHGSGQRSASSGQDPGAQLRRGRPPAADVSNKQHGDAPRRKSVAVPAANAGPALATVQAPGKGKRSKSMPAAMQCVLPQAELAVKPSKSNKRSMEVEPDVVQPAPKPKNKKARQNAPATAQDANDARTPHSSGALGGSSGTSEQVVGSGAELAAHKRGTGMSVLAEERPVGRKGNQTAALPVLAPPAPSNNRRKAASQPSAPLAVTLGTQGHALPTNIAGAKDTPACVEPAQPDNRHHGKAAGKPGAAAGLDPLGSTHCATDIESTAAAAVAKPAKAQPTAAQPLPLVPSTQPGAGQLLPPGPLAQPVMAAVPQQLPRAALGREPKPRAKPAGSPHQQPPACPAGVLASMAAATASTDSGGDQAPAADVAPPNGRGNLGPLLPSGSTPLAQFVPLPLPPINVFGQQERAAVVSLQQQLRNLQAMYEELKASKMQALESMLAEHEQTTQDRIEHVRKTANHWQAEAEKASAKLQEGSSRDTLNKVAELQARNTTLLGENGQLLLRVAHLERELALVQQEKYDLQATVMRLQQQQQQQQGMVLLEHQHQEEHQEEVNEAERDAGTGAGEDDLVNGQQQVAMPPPGVAVQAAPGPSSATASPSLYVPTRGIALQFPTPSPGIGVQFPTPGLLLQTNRTAGSGAGGASSGPGFSTECGWVIQMLPQFRALTPLDTQGGAQSRLQPSSGPLSVQRADAAPASAPGAATPAAARPLAMPAASPAAIATVAKVPAAAPSITTAAAVNGKSKRSTGSPIDGLCNEQQLAAAKKMASDVAFAHDMRAPEAFPLGMSGQQDEYSFVDLEPISVRKAVRPATAAAGEQELEGGVQQQVADAGPVLWPLANAQQADLGQSLQDAVQLAASQPLPSPQAQGANKAAQSRAQLERQNGFSFHAPPGPTAVPASQPAVAAGTASMAQGLATALGNGGEAAGNRDSAARNSGSVLSNQDSCAGSAWAGAPPVGMPQAAMAHPATAGLAPKSAVKPSVGRSPVTAEVLCKLRMQLAHMEASMGAHVELLSREPAHLRYTYAASGLTFDLMQAVVDDEELAEEIGAVQANEQEAGGLSAALLQWQYMPVDLGNLAATLPTFLQEPFTFPCSKLDSFTKMLGEAQSKAAALQAH